MITKLQRDFIAADLAAIEDLLSVIEPSDFPARINLESRRDELRENLTSAEVSESRLASSEVFFSGRPVIASRGIDSKFAAASIARYQSIVSTVYANNQATELRNTGPVRGVAESKLFVTEVVHGSFGFKFEELEDQTTAFDSHLKESVDQTTNLLRAFGETSDDSFNEAAANINSRVLNAVRKFFTLVNNSGAYFQVVSGNVNQNFDQASIFRAIQRAQDTTIQESTREALGIFKGVLPSNREFEFEDTGGMTVLKGRISSVIPDDYVSRMNADVVDRVANAAFRVKSVLRQGVIRRESFVLESVSLYPNSFVPSQVYSIAETEAKNPPLQIEARVEES